MILITNYLSNHDDTWAVFDHCEETLAVPFHINISLRREGFPFVSSPKHGHWHSKEQRGAAPSKALPRILRNGTHHLVVGREVDKMFSKSSHPLFLIIIRIVYVAKPRSFKHSKPFSFCIALICELADIKADKWAETGVLSRISCVLSRQPSMQQFTPPSNVDADRSFSTCHQHSQPAVFPHVRWLFCVKDSKL